MSECPDMVLDDEELNDDELDDYDDDDPFHAELDTIDQAWLPPDWS